MCCATGREGELCNCNYIGNGEGITIVIVIGINDPTGQPNKRESAAVQHSLTHSLHSVLALTCASHTKRLEG